MKKLELVMIAAAAAGAVVTGNYPEAAAVILLYIGLKLLEKKLDESSRELRRLDVQEMRPEARILLVINDF